MKAYVNMAIKPAVVRGPGGQETGYRIQVTAHRLEAFLRIQVTGYRPQARGFS